jgi:polyisoprenoid-binding protein YceI
MRRLFVVLLATLALRSSLTGQAGQAGTSGIQEFRVDDAWGRDTVQFRTSAVLEDIVGTTNQVTGVLKADRKNLLGTGTAARIEVDLTSLKTGIEMRDGHVAKALGADKAPTAVFTLEKIKSVSSNVLETNTPVDLVGEGAFELKGVKKTVEVAARLSYVPRGGPFNQMRPGDFVKLRAEFDVKLADFGVDRQGPVLPLQVAETAHVTVTVLASDASPEEAEQYRQTAIKYMGKARR